MAQSRACRIASAATASLDGVISDGPCALDSLVFSPVPSCSTLLPAVSFCSTLLPPVHLFTCSLHFPRAVSCSIPFHPVPTHPPRLLSLTAKHQIQATLHHLAALLGHLPLGAIATVRRGDRHTAPNLPTGPGTAPGTGTGSGAGTGFEHGARQVSGVSGHTLMTAVSVT
jgi:hypothetical protein